LRRVLRQEKRRAREGWFVSRPLANFGPSLYVGL
jgi:hypothetical protein